MTNEERIGRTRKCAVGSALIALVFIVLLVLSIYKRKALVEECTETTTGGVVTVFNVTKARPQPTLSAAYEVNGVRYTAEGRYDSGYSIADTLSGKPVTVHYSPDNPSKAYAADGPVSASNWLFASIIGIFGIGAILFILQGSRMQK